MDGNLPVDPPLRLPGPGRIHRVALPEVRVSHRRIVGRAAAAAGTWLARNGGGTLVLHTGFPLENWYPRRWGSFLGSLNELLDAVPGNVRFAVANTPLPAGRGESVLEVVARCA